MRHPLDNCHVSLNICVGAFSEYSLQVVYIIFSFTALTTAACVTAGEAFQLFVSMSQTVCEIHLITCLLSVSHNYLRSSSPRASL